MSWIFLVIAGLFETAWAIGLKYTEGFSRLVPSIFTVVCMVISFGLLSYSLKTLPIGTAYAIWTGIGAVGTVLFGMIFLKEPTNVMRILFILLIVAGILGLKFTETSA
ncbi:quaternary ammonium compound efflux SMR transporter SugE [Thermoflavimicrobium daqui]|jgi:quaternary ammonium compound-resistance protein SugE|uniref:Quaternary ammonium compound-resistance protein SugE n=1 Tax=Thermoflavimicrobium daqui TaxID=2137476 RepID=A0A364K212_9BACL|nr:quaternary ammonium compound efflux SMR transporter SugE [Thermoflavimicrobium daqui]RAL22061.1 quaternary ammonium compound-resistance protein SugE [Thermoflavimicrobium daqui]